MRVVGFSGPETSATVPVFELAGDVLPFLAASRYCETDLLSNFAWSYFGGIVGGWAKVQGICDFVHDRLVARVLETWGHF